MPYSYVTPVNPNSNNPSTMAASNTQPPSILRPCSLPHHHHRNLFFCRHHPNPCHHHHRHHFSPNCPLHSYLFHPKLCPSFTVPPPPPPPQNPEPAASIRSTNNSNTHAFCFLTYSNGSINLVGFGVLSRMMQEENEELEEEYEDEPVFVLTDEWREFFAKSEAKRRLAKKEAKKKGKH